MQTILATTPLRQPRMVSPSKMAAFVLAALAQTLKNIKQFRRARMSKKNTAQSEQRMVMGLWVVVEGGVEKLKDQWTSRC